MKTLDDRMRRKKVLFRVILAGIILGTSLGLAELTARLIPRPHKDIVRSSSEFQYDPILGLKGIPGYSGRVGFTRAHVSINAHGFRDDDWDAKLERAHHHHAEKVLCIGDSTLYGHRIEKADRLTEQLAALCERSGQVVEIFNAAMPSFGTGQEYRCLETLFPIIQPDVVILRYCRNDFGDSALPYDYRYPARVYKPFYDLEGNLILHDRVPRRFSLWAESTCLRSLELNYAIDNIMYFFQDMRFSPHVYINRRADGSLIHPLTRRERGRINSLLGALSTNSSLFEVYQANKQRNYSLWKKMSMLCDAGGAKFMMLIDVPFQTPSPTQQEQDLIAFLQREQFDVVNISASQNPYREWAYVRGDGHPNFLDNYIAAHELSRRWVDQDLIVDLVQAPWHGNVPLKLSMGHYTSLPFIFGSWGRLEGNSRLMGSPCYCLIRSPSDDPASLTFEGRILGAENTEVPIVGCESNRYLLHVTERGKEIADLQLPNDGLFSVSISIPAPADHLLLLGLETHARIALDRIYNNTDCWPSAQSVDINVGSAEDSSYLEVGFYGRENGPGGRKVRWTGADARIGLCLESGAGAYLLEVTYCTGNRSKKAPALEFTVGMNGTELTDKGPTWMDGHLAKRRFEVPGPLLRAGRNEMIIHASTWVPAAYRFSGDTRALGVMIDHIHILPLSTTKAPST